MTESSTKMSAKIVGVAIIYHDKGGNHSASDKLDDQVTNLHDGVTRPIIK
jgi:hypothetical protein